MILGALGLFLLIASVSTGLVGSSGQTHEAILPRSLAEKLSASTWAFAVPTAWLGTPIAEIAEGDSVDLLGVRTSDRPLAMAIAADLRVMSVDEHAVIFEVDEESATAIATARAGGFLIVPLLRSTR